MLGSIPTETVTALATLEKLFYLPKKKDALSSEGLLSLLALVKLFV